MQKARSSILLPVLVVATAVTIVSPCDATEISIQLSRAFTCGEYVELKVELTDPERGLGTPVLRPVPGMRIAGPRGPSSRTFTRQDGRGRTVKRSISYSFFLQPDGNRTGEVEIGPVRVPRSKGTDLVSTKAKLTIARKPPMGVKVLCEVSPPSGPIGAPCRVVYTILYSPSQGPRVSFGSASPFLKALGFPVLTDDDLKVESVPAFPGREQSVVPLDDRRLVYQTDFRILPDGTGYDSYIFAFDVVPRKTNKYEFGRAKATMGLPTGRVRQGAFGLRQQPELVERSGVSESLVYEAYNLPREGQPAIFTGAIGRFTIAVTASETRVRAFDPIELEVAVTGEGLLEDLAAPDWTRFEGLTKDFRVSADVSSGRNDVEAKTKVFRQTVRALRADISHIPALPIAYYDPWERKYVTAYSKPIPIEVAAARTVGADDSIGPNRPQTDAPDREEERAVLVVEESGIPGNFSTIGAQLPSPVSHRELLRTPFLVCAVAPPLAFALLLVVRSLRRRDPAHRIRGRALPTAHAALSAANEDHEAMAHAYQDYFRQKLHLPAGELTPRQLHEALGEHGASDDLATRAVDCLDRILTLRFGASDKSASELSDEARTILSEIDRC